MNKQIKSITLKNVFGYKELHLDFIENQRSLIMGRNDSGKSSLADAISWIAYGTWPRANKISSIVHKGADKAEGELVFFSNEKIMRTRTKKDAATLEIANFDIKTIGNRAGDKQAVIDAILGDFNTYKRTAYMMRGFLSIADPSLRPAERRLLLRKFFNIEYIEEATKNARALSSDFSAKIEAAKNSITSLQNTLTPDDDIENADTLKKYLKELDEKKQQIELIYQNRVRYNTAKNNAESIQNNIASANHTLETLKRNEPNLDANIDAMVKAHTALISKYDTWIEECDKQLVAKKEKYDKINAELSVFSSSKGEIESEIVELSTWLSENEDALHNYKIISSAIDVLKERIRNVPEAINCPECGTELLIGAEGAQHREEVITALNKELFKKEAELQTSSKLTDLFKNKKDRLNELQEVLSKVNEFQEAINRLIDEGNDLKKQKEIHEQNRNSDIKEHEMVIEKAKEAFKESHAAWKVEIKKVDQQIADYKISLENKQSIMEDLYSDKFKTIEQDRHEIELKINNVKEKIIKSEEQKKHNTSVREEIKNINASSDKAKKDKVDIDFWVTHFPIVEETLMQDSVSMLELETNKWLQILSNAYNVSFVLEKKGVYTSVTENGVEWDLTQKGSGIGSRVALASTFALSNVLKKVANGPSWIIIDEAIDGLDTEGIEALFDLIQHIDGQRFIISHADSLKNGIYDKIYEIGKINGKSVIQEF